MQDHTQLLVDLAEAYTQHSPRSAAMNQRALQVLVDGGSHALRLSRPFPLRLVAAQGACVTDEDGNEILDFFQGHYTNILGHNPEVVTTELARAFESRFGLQTGFTDRLQVEAAEILCQQTGAERVRFTTSGSLATMYAILLARAYTERDLVMKVGGGWHGGQPWGLKGVSFYASNGDGFKQVDTHGLPPALTDEVVVTRFNDPGMLEDHFRQYGDRLACFIVEPFIGAKGFIPARLDYLRAARELSHKYGAVLIFDEVISGFRFRAGDLGSLYGVQPDLATFGKVVGGGMPVAAVAGRADILGLVGREGGSRVKFSGGTFSGHPASMLAAKTVMSYLLTHEDEIYSRLAQLGEMARHTAEAAFAQEGVVARCTGYPNQVLPGSSMAMCHFPHRDDALLERPDQVRNPAVCDVILADVVLQLALLLEDVYVMHGLGAMSTAHNEEHIARLADACRRAARRIKPYLT